MWRIANTLLVSIGGTALAIWLERQNVAGWIWLLVAGVSYAGAALIFTWPRWRAASSAFWHYSGAAGKKQLPTVPGTPEMRFDRPVVLPVKYEKGPDGITSGLYVRTGYDAINVRVPNVAIPGSVYMLTFPETLSLLCERDHPHRFLEGWLEDQTNTLPGLDGGHLREVMRKANVEVVKFGIVYQGTDFFPYRTNCVFKIKPKGIEVEAINQEPLPRPPD